MQQATPFPASPEDLSDQFLNAYVENFLDIADFKAIENAKGLLEMIREHPDHPKLKPAIRKVVGLFGCDAPAGKVCALQFLKEALEAGSLFAVESIEKSVLVHFAEIIEYRSSVRSIQRGSTYFIREIDKDLGDDEMMNLVKLSSTFFRMVHECLYVWGALYFPGSAFDRLRLKMEKKVPFPEFAKDFKFFSEGKVSNFKEKCAGLIRRVEERGLIAAAEANSILSKKSQSIIKDRNPSNSPRSIKKTKQPPKIQPQQQQKQQQQQKPAANPSKQMRKMNDQQDRQQRELQKLQQEAEVPPSSKRTKRHKSKKAKQAKKQLIQQQIKEQKSEKTLQNNSSKMRKKNSFVEVPFNLQNHHSNKPMHHSSSELNKLQGERSKEPTSKGEALIKTIQQNEQSDGGRYSIQDTISKESEISEVMYDYNNREASSPRSQYSMANKQNRQFNLKRENSDQLPPSITVRGKNFQKQAKVIIKQEKRHTNGPLQYVEKQSAEVQNKLEQAQRKQKHSFKLPLDEIKGRLQVSPPRASHHKNQEIKNDKEKEKERKGKKGELTARKKFVSSEQESVKQIKPQQKITQKVATIAKLFNDNSSIEYQNEPKNNTKLQQKRQSIPLQKGQQGHNTVPVPPKPKQVLQPQSSKQIPQAMPAKAAKPIKLKSNSNLKTVFESSDYKIVENSVKKDDQSAKKQTNKGISQSKQKRQNPANKSQKGIPKQSKMPSLGQQMKKGSIFEEVQADTIETINELTPVAYKPDTRQSSPAIAPKSQQYKQQHTLKTANPKEKNSQQAKIERESIPKEIKQPNARQQRSISVQDSYRRGFSEPSHVPVQSQQQIKQEKHLQIIQDRRSTNIEAGNELRSIKSTRQNSIHSSRFRQFKQVNLFIEPKIVAIPHSPSTPQKLNQLSQANENSMNSEFKLQIMEELNKIKSAFLQKEENLNNTLMSLKSEIVAQKKENDEAKIEVSTQTKLKHKSKGKFERKSKYKMFDEGSQSEENCSTINIPKQIANYTSNIQLSSIQNTIPKALEAISSIERKKSVIEKEELKPNTLLYALYKRKYSNK